MVINKELKHPNIDAASWGVSLTLRSVFEVAYPLYSHKSAPTDNNGSITPTTSAR